MVSINSAALSTDLVYFYIAVKSVTLGKEHHFAIVAALSQLEELCKSIYTQTITLDSLNNVKRRTSQLRKLCDAISSSKEEQYFTYSELEPRLEECYKLQEMFEDFKNRISVLVHFCSNISHGMRVIIVVIVLVYKSRYKN